MGSSHNNIASKEDGLEYNIFIFADFKTGIYHATENSTFVSHSGLYEVFVSESEAVFFVCEHFYWFECF